MLTASLVAATAATLPALAARLPVETHDIATAIAQLIQAFTDAVLTAAAQCPTHELPYAAMAFWSLVELTRACAARNPTAIIGGVIKCAGYASLIWLR